METKSEIDLYDLETIEANLRTDDAPPSESEDDPAHAAAAAFMIG